MPSLSAQAMLSGIALIGLIVLTGLMVFFPVPPANHDFVVAGTTALATALTITGGSKLADKLTQATGDNPIVQPDAGK